eukprot:1241893-Ditylum_brightwellii.AAC.1
MIQILLQALIGWNPDTKKGKKGIFGTPMAWGALMRSKGIKHYTLIGQFGLKMLIASGLFSIMKMKM